MKIGLFTTTMCNTHCLFFKHCVSCVIAHKTLLYLYWSIFFFLILFLYQLHLYHTLINYIFTSQPHTSPNLISHYHTHTIKVFHLLCVFSNNIHVNQPYEHLKIIKHKKVHTSCSRFKMCSNIQNALTYCNWKNNNNSSRTDKQWIIDKKANSRSFFCRFFFLTMTKLN